MCALGDIFAAAIARIPVPVPTSRKRSEEHTSELQSQSNLVCRLLLDNNRRTRLGGEVARCSRRRLVDRTPSRHQNVIVGPIQKNPSKNSSMTAKPAQLANTAS